MVTKQSWSKGCLIYHDRGVPENVLLSSLEESNLDRISKSLLLGRWSVLRKLYCPSPWRTIFSIFYHADVIHQSRPSWIPR
jgi:hypothetical protein